MTQKFADNCRALLVASILSTDTTLTVEAAKADRFPIATTTSWGAVLDWFKCVLIDSLGNREVIKVGTRALGSGVFGNILRAQDGTTALAFTAGSLAICPITAADIMEVIGGSFAALASADTLDVAGKTTLADPATINHGGIETRPVPVGGIIMWSGALAAVPTGWALCMTGESEVLLADGTKRPIQEIVEGRQEVEVMAFNEDTGRLEPRRVVDWFVKESSRDEFTRLKFARGKSEGKRSLDVTHDHPIWIVGKGWTTAEQVQPGDQVLIHQPTITDDGHQAILGQWLGDGSASESGVFSVSHGAPQREYIQDTARRYGVSVHESIQPDGGYGAGLPTLRFRFGLNTLAPETASLLVGKKVRRDILRDLGPIGLAYWYMDDGNLQTDDRAATPTVRAQLHTEGFDTDEIELLIEWFGSAHGISATAYQRPNTDGKTLRFDDAGTRRFLSLIAPYVHPSMRYKLPAHLQATPYLLEDVSFIEDKPTRQYVQKVLVSELSPSKRNNSQFHRRYDIKVEGLHSFVANGFVVHNCDGTNGTPDLRDRFVMGSGSSYGVGATGGSKDAVAISHTHTVTVSGTTGTESADHSHGVYDPGHSHGVTVASGGGYVGEINLNGGSVGSKTTTVGGTGISITGRTASHTHNVTSTGTAAASGSAGTNLNLPPYYALAFICCMA